MNKIPYMLVIGEQEQANGTVAVRHRTAGDSGAVAVGAFIERCQREIATRAL